MINLPMTSEGLLDRTIDDHKRSRDLPKIALRDQALQTIYRIGILSLPEDEQLPRDPESIPTGILRA